MLATDYRRWVCALGLLTLISCRSADRGPAHPLNLLLVTIDTLRPDRLGCYGYTKTETPNLDHFARRGVRFENAVAQVPLTAPSHASIFTGLYPTVHGVRDTGGFILPASHETMAEILQRQGWDTAAFVGSSVLKKSFGFGRGFTVYDDQMPKADARRMAVEFPERRAGEVVDRALAWLHSRTGKPYFLWVHVFDPHSPYDPPSPFHEKYANSLYDGEVAYTDRELGRLFDAAGKQNTLMVVMSDHGESLSDHGEYTHGVFLYDSTLRIALLMAGPGIPADATVKQQVRTIDVLPTVLTLMGVKTPPAVQGSSLTPAFTTGSVPGEAYVETLYPKINMGWTELRAMRTNRWKYIRAPKPELYDLAADPAETRNVIDSHASEVRDLEARLQATAGVAEKVQTAAVDRRTMDQLKSLGYLGGASQGEFALTGKGIDPKDRIPVLKALYLAMSPDAGGVVSERIPLLRKALAEDPANPALYYYLGQEYADSKRYAEAMQLNRQGIANGVRTGWIYSRLGFLYLREGNRDEAIAAYERAAQLNPADCESLNDLGMAYLDTGQVPQAERVFQWCLAADPEFALAHNGLGLAAVRKQDVNAARGHFEKAVQLDPGLLEAQLNLGRIYRMIGANTRARACFEAFLAKASPAEYGEVIPRVKAELAELQ